jgi:signal transduction histidine kinase
LLAAFLWKPAPRLAWAAISLLVAGIGLLDFSTGLSASLSMLYLVPIALATGWRGARVGAAVAIACALSEVVSDLAIQGPQALTWTKWWNSSTALVIDFFLVWLLNSLIALHRTLEATVQRRTSELEDSIADRQRLQRDLLAVSARERSAIGRELHDDLGQHLVATAMAGQVLMRSLPGKAAADAAAIVRWIEEAIAKSRKLARGLLLANIAPERFPLELEELATTSSRGELQCRLRHNGRPAHADSAECAQLFRIAQEAVANALRHAAAKSIDLTLATDDDATCLIVEDDGKGMATPRATDGVGMGLQIMQHRAKFIGASFSVLSAPGEGTKVICRIPRREPAAP